jgi:hypothetical protein
LQETAAALSRLIDTACSDIKARVENGYLRETPEMPALA